MHAIYVRNCDVSDADTTQPLAIDIADAPAAQTLARNVAEAFPVNGQCWRNRAYWFRTREGRHEIWSAPDRLEQAPASPEPRSLRSRLKRLLRL